MQQTTEKIRCKYVEVCYLSGALQCFGYKSDCILYIKSNNQEVTEQDFHDAVNLLISDSRLESLKDI